MPTERYWGWLGWYRGTMLVVVPVMGGGGGLFVLFIPGDAPVVGGGTTAEV